MFENKNQVVSNFVGSSSTFAASETPQDTLNPSNLNFLVKTTRQPTAEQKITGLSKKVKSTRKIFAFVKGDVEKAINKATNLRNYALKKVHQAKDITLGAKEDWITKVITVRKKTQEYENDSQNKYLLKQLKQAKQDAIKARENLEAKKSDFAQKKLYLQECEANLQTVIKIQNSRIEAAKMACQIARRQEEKAIFDAK